MLECTFMLTKYLKPDYCVNYSMTGVNHCYGNAFAESFFGTLKKDLIKGKIFQIRDEADAAMFEYIEKYYNRFRIHSFLDFLFTKRLGGTLTIASSTTDKTGTAVSVFLERFEL